MPESNQLASLMRSLVFLQMVEPKSLGGGTAEARPGCAVRGQGRSRNSAREGRQRSDHGDLEPQAR